MVDKKEYGKLMAFSSNSVFSNDRVDNSVSSNNATAQAFSKSGASSPFNVERMNRALESKVFVMPSGLSRQQRREFILKIASNN